MSTLTVQPHNAYRRGFDPSGRLVQKVPLACEQDTHNPSTFLLLTQIISIAMI